MFWFLEGFIFSLISSDIVLGGDYSSNRSITSVNGSSYFNTSNIDDVHASSGGFIDTTIRMFTFRLSSEMFPSFLNAIISFLNWFLLLLAIMSIYRIANPLS